MARTKHERTLQRKNKRQVKAPEKEEGEGGAERNEQDKSAVGVEVEAVNGRRGEGEERRMVGLEMVKTADDTAGGSTTEEICDVEKRAASPVEDGEGAVRMRDHGVQEEEKDMVSASEDKLTSAGDISEQDTRTESACSEKEAASKSAAGLNQDAIDSLLERLETEISTRAAQPTKTTAHVESEPQVPPKQELCVHEEPLQRLQAQLEKARKREEMLTAENDEWRRAAKKQQDFRAEIQATHVLRRTQAAQLRRVVETLETAGRVTADTVPALHAIANALFPSETDQATKSGHIVAGEAMVFPARHPSSCHCGRGPCRWPVKKEEEGDATDEYAFRVFRLAEEPLKKRRYTSLEKLQAAERSFKTNNEPHANQIADMLKGYEQKLSGHYIYEPASMKSRRKRGRPSSGNEASSSDDGDLSDTSLEVALSVVDPTTPVHPGSEDVFSMVAL